MAEYLIQDTTLDAIADAINAKTGGSSAMTPTEMVTAIGSISGGGGDPWEMFDAVNGNTLTALERSDLLTIRNSMFKSCTNLKSVRLENATKLEESAFEGSGIITVFAPKAVMYNLVFKSTGSLQTVVIKGPVTDGFTGYFSAASALRTVDFVSPVQGLCYFNSNTGMNKIILRGDTFYSLSGGNRLNNTAFAQGQAGGEIYIAKALYDHLGDGSSLDYKAATNWSMYDGYGTITWRQIEGSIYETQYADGTPIPSA